MRAAAAEAVGEYLRNAPQDHAAALEGLVCEYAGVVQQNGSYDPGAPLRSHSKVVFCWKLPPATLDGSGRHFTVETFYQHAVARGVAFPVLWHTALQCRDLQLDADASARKFSDARGLCGATCHVLGQPCRAPAVGAENGVGSIVLLPLGSAMAEYVLCAHVRDAIWVCTRGRFVDGGLADNDPFGAEALVVKNLQQQAPRLEDAPRKRVRAHFHPGQLEDALKQRPDAWDAAVAIATWRAEAERANLEGRVPEQRAATAGFERDRFAWRKTHGRHMQVTLLWTWRESGEEQCRFMVARLDNLCLRGVPWPEKDAGHEDELWRNLVDVADRETELGKAPCVYLGLAVGAGNYEADPSKWRAQYYPASLGKTKATVHYKWEHVSIDSTPHTVAVSVSHLLHNKRALPQHPLAHSAPSNLRFSVEFMQAVAQNVYDGVAFKGIAFEGERLQIVPQLPQGGVDLQDAPVYWTLPDGRCVCWSVRSLAEAREDSLVKEDSEEAYRAVAKEMSYDVLGTAPDEVLEPFRLDPGTFAERRWEKIEWHCPRDETCVAWFIANAGEQDPEAQVKLVAKSLACLRLELHATRCATSYKLRQAWERRLEENGLAVDALLNNSQLWRHVGGPDPELLRQPCEADLIAARAAAKKLRCMLIAHGDKAQDGLDVFAEECIQAVAALKQVTWESIRRERFFLTPKGLYDELVRNAQINLNRRDDESARRRARLAAPVSKQDDDTQEASQLDAAPRPVLRYADKYGLDLDVFKNKSRRKPHNWQRAVRQASEVHLDEMHVLLSMHYDAVHLENWQAKQRRAEKRAPERKGEYKVFRSCIEGHRRKLNQRLELPAAVRAIFKKPEDELVWTNLEALRGVICSLLEAETEIGFDREELDGLAAALEASPSTIYPDEVGAGCKLPVGARALVPHAPDGNVKERRARIVAAVREMSGEWIVVRALLRPRCTERSPPLDTTARMLFGDAPLQQACEDASKSMQELFDAMLLVLWDALFLNQCEKWTRDGHANLPESECVELARWFLRGQAYSSKSIVDGICSQCGALLHGACNQSSALSNKRTGPPTNRDGTPLYHPDGSPVTEAQPPFLLRWSPGFYASEAPVVFAHDPETNRLSLQPGVGEPWLAPPGRGGEDKRTWLYCNDCWKRWFPEGRKQSHIPFRDAASQAYLKPVRRSGKPPINAEETPRSQRSAAEPEAEPAEALPEASDEPAAGDLDEEDDVEVPDLPLHAPEKRPTLEEYQERWNAGLAWHARAVPGEFSRDNLVPAAVPQLWQDCPHVPFGALKSVDAQSRLSVCRPHSSLEPANCADGTPRYAHCTGDVNYRRRAMLQLSSTMGFLLNKTSGRFMHLTPAETDALHEVMTWLRVPGHNRILTFFSTIYESFQQACRTLVDRFQNVIPEGSVRARIRATRRESHDPKEGVLGDTMGEEGVAMVVVDSAGHPMKYDALKVFESVVATQSARIEVDVPGEGGRGWRRTNSVVNTQQDEVLNDSWREDLAAGCRHIGEETWVPANDSHFDAKVFPCVHPHGTGSLLSEPGAGGTQRHARNRLMLLQSWFRRSAQWGFWSLNRLIQTELFFKNKARRTAGRKGASAANDPDPIVRLFGTAQPSDIPESSEWWKRQQRDLFALTDEAEQGLMTCMITVTANDSSPEMLAAIRRGPFAQPTEEECIEYMLQRKRRDQERPAFENYSLEHVLAFQRRVGALKDNFMRRGERTPLGVVRDWWDRTEAQMRAALHSHILVWMKPRKEPENYVPLKPIPREAVGTEPKQRPRNQQVPKLSESEFQHDNCYHRAEFGHVRTEMVRPSTDGWGHGGFVDYEKLRIAGLARAIQTRLYLHSCSHKYCLQNRSSCRFFFPFPEQPQQQYCMNCERVCGQRRCEEDDQWVNPHELYMAMFSPATVHCLPFDPRYGADTARQYCGKYASKSEKWYYLETSRGGVRDFIKCRTVGLCMAHNRLLSYRVVRNTRPVVYTPADFVPLRENRTPRDPEHLERQLAYPDPQFYLSASGKYFFRHPELRHMRLEQYNRYFATTGDRDAADGPTLEDTMLEDDAVVQSEPGHRHYDAYAEGVLPGTVYPSTGAGVEGARRRRQARLAVSRVPFLEPIADKREAFYEQRLLLGLAWFLPERPVVQASGDVEWRFVWEPPPEERLGGAQLEPQELVLGTGAVSFEYRCAVLESRLCQREHDLICRCCAEELPGLVCDACRYAVGFHTCMRDPRRLRWRKGTLHAGFLDGQRVLFNLHRRGIPMATLTEKADEYVAAGLLLAEDARAMVRAIEQERGVHRMVNEIGGADDATAHDRNSARLSPEEMRALLAEREANLQAGGMDGKVTDQWRCYSEIIEALQSGRRLRLLVQASAGTGKSYVMTTVMLWCAIHGKKSQAAAPTGIAASNIDIEGVPQCCATTLHAMFDLDVDLSTKLDFAKTADKRVKKLLELEVLLLDEISMIDTDAWLAMAELLSIVDHTRRPDARDNADALGSLAVILFGDYKQLPPATSKPPFVVLPMIAETFDFRVLRQNRRVCTDDARKEELEEFHGVLHDISWGRASERVKRFCVASYVRGARVGSAERCELEGSTGVFTKRRYRDRWNRTIVRRVAKVKSHTLKIKGRVRARGARGKDWFSEHRTQMARKRSRTQALFNLHLAGDWHPDSDAGPPIAKRHLMRCMLVSNLALDQRFCNGCQGRVLHWHPAKAQARKAISASHPELLVRFAKESSLSKAEMQPDIDHMDITARQETLVNVAGLPVLLQEPLVPCYALTVHKTQALSIRHVVRGCLEGIFAQGQLYVLVSRVTDPRNFQLVGLPPADLLPDVCAALSKEGLDPIESLRRCVTVTNEWVYTPGPQELRDRFTPRYTKERMVPIVHRELHEMLNPQPRAQAVTHRLLDWIDRCDWASQRGEPKPPFATTTGESIFPEDDEPWWLTDAQKKPTAEAPPPGDEDGPHVEEGDLVDEVGQETDDEDPSDASADPEEAPKENEEEGDSQALERPPRIAWKQNAGYGGYFEKQRGAHCGMHALNNAVGRAWQTIDDMRFALDDYLATTRSEGLSEVRAEHAKPSGWYSSEVMCHAVNTTSMRHAGRVEYVLELQPLHVNVGALRSAAGAVVNIRNRHWVAIRRVANQLWLLDSQEPQALPMSEADLKAFVMRHRAAFPLVRAENMGAAAPWRRASTPDGGATQTSTDAAETQSSLSGVASSTDDAVSLASHAAVVLPLARRGSCDVSGDMAPPLPCDQGAQLMEVDSEVSSLSVAEQHGADDAMEMIQGAYDERARELEAEILAARSSFQEALRTRGGR